MENNEIIGRFNRLLRNVALNTVNQNDQSFALDLLVSLASKETQVNINPNIILAGKLGISTVDFERIQSAVMAGNRICAIKILREAKRSTYGTIGLKEAKDAVENPGLFKQPI